MNPKFSVIVPVYNVEPFLENCIESILNQTYSNFELILVDDGSSDGCPQICDYYARLDPRIRVIHKMNGGPGSARIAGAKEVRGDYVCCVDGDDWIKPNYLELFAKCIDSYDADIVCCNDYIVTENSVKENKSIIRPGTYNREAIERVFFPFLLENEKHRYFPPTVWGKAIRTKIYLEEQKAVDPVIVIGEDRAVVIPCVYHSNCIVVLDVSLYYYRVNMQSMTRNKICFSWHSLEAFASHFPKRLKLREYDFRAQYDRLIAHQFFLGAKSQFNREEPYRVIKQEIIEKMKEPIFTESIHNCRFSGSVRAKMMEYCLKKHILFPIYIFSKLK